MKKMKFLALALTLLMGISFTSCFNSDGDNAQYDGGTFVTVIQSYGLTLKTDAGIIFTPTNPSSLLLADKVSYPKRAFVYYKLADGEKIVDGKTNYTVSIVGGFGIEVKNFNLKPDTLKNDYSIISMDSWYANGYVTVGTNFYYSNNSVSFDLYQQKVGNDTVYVKLNYSKGGGTGSYNETTTYYSLELPYIENIQPKNDSIWVKISAKGPDNKVLEKNVHCKYDYYN